MQWVKKQRTGLLAVAQASFREEIIVNQSERKANFEVRDLRGFWFDRRWHKAKWSDGRFMYRIQTDARVITGNTTEIKNRGRRMLIKTDRGSTTYFLERLSWRYCLPTAAASTCRTPASICRTPASICRTPASICRTPASICRTPASSCYSKPLKSSDKPSGLFISAFQSEWKVLLLALLVFLPFPRKKKLLLSRR